MAVTLWGLAAAILCTEVLLRAYREGRRAEVVTRALLPHVESVFGYIFHIADRATIDRQSLEAIGIEVLAKQNERANFPEQVRSQLRAKAVEGFPSDEPKLRQSAAYFQEIAHLFATFLEPHETLVILNVHIVLDRYCKALAAASGSGVDTQLHDERIAHAFRNVYIAVLQIGVFLPATDVLAADLRQQLVEVRKARLKRPRFD